MGRRIACVVGLACVVAMVGCGGDDDTTSGGDGGVPTLGVSGTVVDFETGMPVSGSATISTQGITPPPMVSVTGANFEITGVPPYSVFFVLSGSPPDYRNTYNVATTVEAADVQGVTAEAVAEAYLTGLETAFAVTPAPGTGVLFVQAVDAAGAPRAGVSVADFRLGGQPPTSGHVLAADLQADMGTVTTASGWLVFFDVPAGTVQIGADMMANVSISAPDAPIAANTASLARATVVDGMAMLPTNVSFANQLVPMFDRRGCAACHSGNGPGRDLGNLTLDGSVNKIYAEVTTEQSPIDHILRVNLPMPEASLILTLPGLPEDRHPNITFASNTDPDYLLLLVWIREGARDN